jgi:CP family cyanate transporter-like MFS transporter
VEDLSIMRHHNRILLIAGILLVATTLRAPFTIIAPLLEGLQKEYLLSATQVGLLITGPVLAFAAVSPFAAGLARRWGMERTLFGSLAVITAGVLVRAGGGVVALYVGTIIVGTGIALGNVLLPSVLKRDFPTKVAALTALYVLTMGVAAAIGSALVSPLSDTLHWDWRQVSRLPLLLVGVAAMFWLPQLTSSTTPAATTMDGVVPTVMWHSPLAWQVTAYFGLDCFLYYVGVSWLPAILRDTGGYSVTQAASLHGLLLLATALPGLVLIPLAPRLRDQRVVAAVLALCMSIGLLGLVLAPAHAPVWIMFFGAGAGGGLILGLALIGLRTAHAHDAAALSGMAQCLGYLFSSAAPPLAGKAMELAGSWHVPLTVCAGLGVVMAYVGTLAGRHLQIGRPTPPVALARMSNPT